MPTAPEPGMELYIISADGEWPIYATTVPDHAVALYDQRKEVSPNRHVRITKVFIGECEALEVQNEIIRRRLVPKGTAIQEQE